MTHVGTERKLKKVKTPQKEQGWQGLNTVSTATQDDMNLVDEACKDMDLSTEQGSALQNPKAERVKFSQDRGITNV